MFLFFYKFGARIIEYLLYGWLQLHCLHYKIKKDTLVVTMQWIPSSQRLQKLYNCLTVLVLVPWKTLILFTHGDID